MPVQETLISVEEYRNTRHAGADRECLDGRAVERNVGYRDHSESGVASSLTGGQRLMASGLRAQNPDIELPAARLFE
jgi:hypothetical protein